MTRWVTTTRQAARLDESLAGTQLSLIDVRFEVPWPCTRNELDDAATALVARHAALRSQFAQDGDQWIVNVHEPGPVRVSWHDRDPGRPVGLEQTELPGLVPPLIWFRAFAPAADGPTSVGLLVEHSVGDGDSVEILVRDFLLLLARAAGRQDVALPPLGREFGEFAAEERAALESGQLDAARDRWAEMFGEVPVTAGVPGGRWAPDLAGDLRAQRALLTSEDTACLDRARVHHRATTAAVFLAAAASAFMEQFDTTDFVCTVPVNTRSKQDRNTVGCFINLMPLRLSWSAEASVDERVQRARETLVALLVHRGAPGIAVVEDPRLRSEEVGDAPVVLIQGAETTEVEALGHRVRVDDGHGTREELGLTVRLVEGAQPHLCVDHDAGRFTAATALELAEATRRWIERLGGADR